MPKTTNARNLKTNNLVITQAELNKLAHEGTKEAIAKIEAYIKSEKDYDKRTYAQMALEECKYFYYQPNNEKEERDFMLCRLINEHKRHIDDLEAQIDKIRSSLDKFVLEQKVHEQVLARHKNKREDWKYRYMDDFVASDRKQLEEITNDIAYKKAWIDVAEKMIASPRYKGGIPERHLSHFNFNDDSYGDNGSCDCCDDGCLACDSDDSEQNIKDMAF